MRQLLSFSWWLTRRRVRAYWRLLLAAFAAVLLAATVMAATVIYANTIAERGLRHALTEIPQDTLNAQLVVQERPLSEQEYRKLQASVERAASERLGDLLTQEQRYGRTDVFQILEVDRGRPPVRGYGFFLTGFEEHAELVRGKWPSNAAPDKPLEVVIGNDLARSMRWDVGMQLNAWPPGYDATESVRCSIVGVAAPKDPREEYWLGQLEVFQLVQTEEGQFTPIYVRERDFFSVIGARYPAASGHFWWRLFLASETLSTSSALEVPGILSALETDVNKLFPNSLFLTTLSSTLSEFQRRLVLAQVPIYLFSALVAAVLLYYLWVVSDLLARSRGQEAAMLRSRGASLSQTAAVMGGLEGVLIALPAVVLGPLLAYLLVRFPLKDALFSGPVSQVLPSISLGAYGMSALIGLLSVSVLIGSGLLVARGNLIEHLRERSRPPATLAMHRYYVDLFVLVVLGLFWWELRDRGGFITQRVLGEGVDVSPLTLLGPVLGLFAAALVLLRVFPLAMRILVRAAEPAGPPWLLHGLRRVARNANLYGALALLLTLSIALGIFGSAFSATLLDARASQVRYQVGGEVVAKVQLPIGASTLVSAQELLTSVDGVSAATPLLRTQGSLVKGAPSSNVNLLALEPASLPETAWFRRDFASASLADLVEPLQTPVAPNAGVPIPGDATSISVWAKPKERYVGLNLWVQIADARSQARNIFIGELDYTDWRLLGGVLPQETSLEAPFRVLGFFMTTGLRGNIGAGSVLLDGLTATTASGVQREVDTLDRVASWIPYAHPGTVEDTVTAVGASRARTGGALEFTWASPVVTGVRGIMQPVVPLPIPAVGGPTLNTGDRLLLHINQAYVPVEITSTVSYFPTVDPRRGGMVLVNLEHYLRYTDSLPFGNSGLPNELWFALDPGADRPATIERLRQMLPGFTTMTDREEEVAKAQRDPLTSGGWRSLVFLGLLALGGTAILGFTLFAALTVRSGRTELAVLETVGFSHGNVLVLIALEFLTVAAVGTAAGAAIGLWVGRWSLGYLSTQGITKASLPPAALALDPGLSTLALAGAGVAAVIATLFALLTAWSLSPGAVLREDA